MTGKELDIVRADIENEGFDYAFEGYSDYREIKDEKFHELRLAYLKARKDLTEYLNVE